MAERIAVSRIIVGGPNARRTITPGTRFRTEDYGIGADELRQWDTASPAIVRMPNDTATAMPMQQPMQPMPTVALESAESASEEREPNMNPDVDAELPAGRTSRRKPPPKEEDEL
jgi:hypothetical protein